MRVEEIGSRQWCPISETKEGSASSIPFPLVILPVREPFGEIIEDKKKKELTFLTEGDSSC